MSELEEKLREIFKDISSAEYYVNKVLEVLKEMGLMEEIHIFQGSEGVSIVSCQREDLPSWLNSFTGKYPIADDLSTWMDWPESVIIIEGHVVTNFLRI